MISIFYTHTKVPFLYVSIITSLWLLNFLKTSIPCCVFKFNAIDRFPWARQSSVWAPIYNDKLKNNTVNIYFLNYAWAMI